jgi:glycine hydroxymethyltransferase
MSERPWLSPAARAFHERNEARTARMSPAVAAERIEALVTGQERHLAECIVLYAGTNEPNPRLARLLGSPIGSRPNLGPPGDTYNRGMTDAAELSVVVGNLLARLLRCRYVETRVGSGSLANLYAFLATCRPGDRILAFSDAFAGHPTHHAVGAAGLAGLEVHDLPCDPATMDVDLSALRRNAHELRPRLLVVAGSMCLHPYDVAGVRAVADEIGAYVLYDAAHMGGLIAGGRFQQPLAEGAHLMTGSTYKSFGGPPAGFVATDDAALAERLDRIAYPGLTANSDLARTAALGVAVADLLAHGEAYADACITAAQALAAALVARGVPVLDVAGKGPTVSQHVAVPAQRWGGGDTAARRLEPAHVLTSSIGIPGTPAPFAGEANALRLGTQELARRGMGPADMGAVADLVARVLVDGEPPEQVRPDTVALRRRFPGLQFVQA